MARAATRCCSARPSRTGIPAAVFGSGEAQWLGTVFERAGEVEGPRVRITSVPYALRASDADTLGGRPASAYLLAPAAGRDGGTRERRQRRRRAGRAAADVVLPGTTNFLAKYVNGADVGNSAVFEAGGAVGHRHDDAARLAARAVHQHQRRLHRARGPEPAGSATAYSGMLFYDQNGALGQFQGFNNVTHEYRINNIARVIAGRRVQRLDQLHDSAARRSFFVATNGNIGIGTTTPSALLEVSNAVPGGPANMWMTSYTNAIGPYYMARRARGTPGAPTAVQNGDGLAGFYGEGYGTSIWSWLCRRHDGAGRAKLDGHGTRHRAHVHDHCDQCDPGDPDDARRDGNLGIGTTVPAAGTRSEQCRGLPTGTVAHLPGITVRRRKPGTRCATRPDGDSSRLLAGYGATLQRTGRHVRQRENWTTRHRARSTSTRRDRHEHANG